MLRKVAITFFLFLGYGLSAQNDLPGLLKRMENEKDTGLVKAYGDLGNYYRYRQNTDSSEFYYKKAFVLAKQINYKRGLANAYLALGGIDNVKKRGREAILKLQEAARIYNEMPGMKSRLALIDGNIGAVYYQQKEFEKGLMYSRRAMQAYYTMSDSTRVGSLSFSIATFFSAMQQFDSALSYAQQAVVYSIPMEKKYAADISRSSEISFYKNLAVAEWGFALAKLKRYAEAVQLLKNGYEQLPETARPSEKLAFLKGLSICYEDSGQLQQSLQYAERMLPVLKQDSIPDLYAFAVGQLSKLYAQTGRYREAYDFAGKLKIVNDSLYNSEKFAAMEDVQARYETTIKDQEILLLNQKRNKQRLLVWLALSGIAVAVIMLFFILRAKMLQKKMFNQKEELLAKEKAIERAALEKRMQELEQMALRAQMNPHFIFNCLSSVQHFVIKQDAEGANKYLTGFAKLVRQTLDNSSKSLISLQEEIQYLEAYLSLEKARNNQAFTYQIAVQESINTGDILIPGMILQPYVENCLKHGIAHMANGNISIRFEQNGTLQCTIEDNGIGREQAARLKENREEAAESKGMDITGSRIALFNKIHSTSIKTTVSDIKDENGAVQGTRVIVNLSEMGD
jgi:tetratricopeptide (TPR) repeat protein